MVLPSQIILELSFLGDLSMQITQFVLTLCRVDAESISKLLYRKKQSQYYAHGDYEKNAFECGSLEEVFNSSLEDGI
jgi:hypothetical protein